MKNKTRQQTPQIGCSAPQKSPTNGTLPHQQLIMCDTTANHVLYDLKSLTVGKLLIGRFGTVP